MFDNWKERYAPSTAKLVRVTWFDASQASREYITPADVNAGYKCGLIDDVVGYLVESTEEWLIIADSYEPDTAVPEGSRRYRSIRNIPQAIVVQMVEVVENAPKIPGHLEYDPEKETESFLLGSSIDPSICGLPEFVFRRDRTRQSP